MFRTASCALACCWLLLAARPLPAQQPVVTRTYAVADLVVPQGGGATLEERLMRLITDGVDPRTWGDVVGRGTIQYFPLGQALVIRQTEAAHRRIAALLDALRKSRIPWYQLA
jgi:hypothetical protein